MAFNAWSLDGVLTPINPQPVSPRNMEHDQKIGTKRRHRHTLDVLKVLLLNVGIRGKLCTLKMPPFTNNHIFVHPAIMAGKIVC